jgi:DNA-binding response OmpR family regulator
MPADVRKHRALLIGGGAHSDQLQTILNSFGYFVEHSPTRREGIRSFRKHRQSLVIVDAESIGGYPERFFRYFRLARSEALVLVASGRNADIESSRYLMWGAHDVIPLPLRPDALSFILGRASAYHRRVLRAAFYRNALYFGAAMVPLWGILLYFAMR